MKEHINVIMAIKFNRNVYKRVDNIMDTIGKRLEYIRGIKGWTKTSVSKRLGLSNTSTYANWEYDYREPNIEMIIKLSKLYGVSSDYLLGIKEKKSISTEYLEAFADLNAEDLELLLDIWNTIKPKIK